MLGVKVKPGPKFCFESFSILSAYRIIERSRKPSANGVVPLDVRAILDYSDIYGLPLEKELFTDCIFAIDDEYLKSVAREIKNRKPSK